MRIKRFSCLLFRISDFPILFGVFLLNSIILLSWFFPAIITIFLSFSSFFYISLHSIFSVSVEQQVSPRIHCTVESGKFKFHSLTLSLRKLTTAVIKNCESVGLHKPQEYVHVFFFNLIIWQM